MFDFSFLQNIPHELSTLLIAMIPIGELRVAIPIAILSYKMSWWSAYIWAVIGNMIPVIFILWLIEPIYKFLIARSKICRKMFDWIFARTRQKLQTKVDKYGALALLIFVMIPLPATGAWSGALAAFIFGMKYKRAAFAIFGGVLLAGVIVTLAVLGAFGAAGRFFR
ncbi:MAG: hypothetical protein ACD_63C00023G0006 [uncultured bacterium]|nr:MAG: hypothetical protein ACD_63C00023G0006 [uncultured bacterium]